ncbi:hypothetical protein ACFL4N_03835 [Thermodesulfobacteriota bacterium]
MEEKRVYTQKEMSQLFGWSRPWLRRIELYGLLPDLDSEPKRGRKGRVYSNADMYRILWVATLRSAGIELADMKGYIEKVKELTILLEKYRTDDGDPLQLVFFHKPQYAEDLFYINPDKIPVDDLMKIGQLAQWLENKADDLRQQIQKWLIQTDSIFKQMHDVGKQASRSMESMYQVNHVCLKNRLLALKHGIS